MSKKIPKSLKIDHSTMKVINFMVKTMPTHHKRKFNPMIEYFIETHPEFIYAVDIMKNGKNK